jgi:hypothetical protein
LRFRATVLFRERKSNAVSFIRGPDLGAYHKRRIQSGSAIKIRMLTNSLRRKRAPDISKTSLDGMGDATGAEIAASLIAPRPAGNRGGFVS